MEDGPDGRSSRDAVSVKGGALEFRDAGGAPAPGTGPSILDRRPCVPEHREQPPDDVCSYVYFEEVRHDLRPEKISAFSTGIRAKLIAVIDSLLAAYTGSEIVVYRWDDALRFRKIRTLRGSLLQFLLETRNIGRGAALVLMKILLFLVRNDVPRCELVLERAMAELGVERALDMWIAGGELHCAYRNLVTCVYDSRLVLLRRHLSVDGRAPAEPAGVVCGDVEVSMHGAHIVVDRRRSFVESIRVGDVSQLIPVANSLFVLTGEDVRVLRFTRSERVPNEDPPPLHASPCSTTDGCGARERPGRSAR